MSEVRKHLVKLVKTKDLKTIAHETGLEYGFLWNFKNNTSKKYRVKYIDDLYAYFGVEKDKRYYENRKSRNKKTYSVIGSILRLSRIKKGYSLDDVATILKGDKRQIQRIEHGDSLPSVHSYYIMEMLKLYDMCEEDQEKIKRGIAILQDLQKIFKKYEDHI